jgi:hypothetical protein
MTSISHRSAAVSPSSFEPRASRGVESYFTVRLVVLAMFLLILTGAGVGVTTAQPKETIRAELIRLQEQTGLTLDAFYNDDLDVVVFASRLLSETGFRFAKGTRMSSISMDGTYVAGEFARLSWMFGTSRLDGTDRRDYPGVVEPYRSCWNRDRSQILLSIEDRTEPFHTVLKILDVNSKTTRTIDASAYVFVTQQCWSPDGKRFVYETQEARREKKNGSSEEVNASVKIYDLVQSKIQELAKGSDPTWSPVGDRIAFRVHDTFYAMSPTGDLPKVLFHRRDSDSGFIWSPDARFVAYTSHNGAFERPFFMDVGPVRLRIRRLSDNSEDWVLQLYDSYLPEFQWIEKKDLISRAHSKNAPN